MLSGVLNSATHTVIHVQKDVHIMEDINNFDRNFENVVTILAHIDVYFWCINMQTSMHNSVISLT